jgi:WD40 repeat protein
VCELILSDNFLIGLGSNDATIRVWDLKNSKDEEMGSLKDKNNIYINNYNTNPKMMEIGRGRIGIINNNDKNVHFDVYKLSIDG